MGRGAWMPVADSFIRAVFVSTASNAMSETALLEIAASARMRNPDNAITGIIVYHDETFFCVMEGSEADLAERMEVVRRDRRHFGITMLAVSEVSERAFADTCIAFRASPALAALAMPWLKPLVGGAVDCARALVPQPPELTEQFETFLRSHRDLA